MQEPRIDVTASAVPEEVRVKAIRTFAGEFSHDNDLPLKLNVKRTGWLGRQISVTTLEPVWYRDAIINIAVPAGFTYDLASIPRTVWPIVAPHEIALESTFHDLLYRDQQVSRRMADMIFLSMMQARGVPFLVRWAVYLAVRLFGQSAWDTRTAQMAAAVLAAEAKAAATGEPLEEVSTLASD